MMLCEKLFVAICKKLHLFIFNVVLYKIFACSINSGLKHVFLYSACFYFIHVVLCGHSLQSSLLGVNNVCDGSAALDYQGRGGYAWSTQTLRQSRIKAQQHLDTRNYDYKEGAGSIGVIWDVMVL